MITKLFLCVRTKTFCTDINYCCTKLTNNPIMILRQFVFFFLYKCAYELFLNLCLVVFWTIKCIANYKWQYTDYIICYSAKSVLLHEDSCSQFHGHIKKLTQFTLIFYHKVVYSDTAVTEKSYLFPCMTHPYAMAVIH